MKYLAILKDSFKEAMDSKILLVLFVLSTLVILVVATMSFTPMSAEATMKQFFFDGKQPPLMGMALNLKKPDKLSPGALGDSFMLINRYRLQAVELLEGEPDAPSSKYALTVAEPNALAAKNVPGEAQRDPLAELRSIFQDSEEIGYLKVENVERLPHAKDNDLTPRYRVIIQGAPKMRRIWATEPSLFFGLAPLAWITTPIGMQPLGVQIYFFAKLILGFGSWGAVLLGVVITSFFFPNMLAKGTVDMMLVKPIDRWILILYKYVGGLSFIFLCTAYAVVGIWFALGIRSGLWATGTLLLIFTTTFFFAILYAISTFIGVLTRSTIVSILLTIGFWFVVFAIGNGHANLDNMRIAEESAEKNGRPVPEERRWGSGNLALGFRIVHAVAPRTEDLNLLNDLIVYTDFMTGNLGYMKDFDTSKRNWWETLLVSSIWIALFVGLAALWFSFKDY